MISMDVESVQECGEGTRSVPGCLGVEVYCMGV